MADGVLRLRHGVGSGLVDVTEVGATIGYTDGVHIVSCGPIQVGVHRYILGVAIGQRGMYLLSGRKLWRLNASLPAAVLPPPTNAADRALWADSLGRACVVRLTSPAELRVIDLAAARYRATVRACVEERMLACAEHGEIRTYDDFARAVSVLWTRADLLEPHAVTVQHALNVALVLALSVERAEKLIEYAGFLEHRAHLITRQGARAMYESAARLVAAYLPVWHAQGYLTDWRKLGDLERVWRSQFARLVRESATRNLTVEQMLQMNAAYLVPELLHTDSAVHTDAWRASAGSAADARLTTPPEDDTPEADD